MEDDGLGLDLPVLDVHLVARQHNGDVLTNSALENFRMAKISEPDYYTLQGPIPYWTQNVSQK